MIRKRNLDNSLIQWVMSVTGLGPGVGEIHYVAPAVSSTSQFRSQLNTMGVEDENLHATVVAAEAAIEGYRNDVVLVAPGAHAVTSQLAWDKDNTHMIGLAGPRSFTDYSEPGVSIYTTTATVAAPVDWTGNYGQLHGINFCNNAADATNLAAFDLGGYQVTVKGCSFYGIMNATQRSVANSSLYIDDGASYYDFTDCVMGDHNWTAQNTANIGSALRYTATGYPQAQNGIFRDCRFQSQSETSTTSLVSFANTVSLDRLHIFDRCLFSNFSADWAVTLSRVFYMTTMHTCQVILKDSMCQGFTEWQDVNHGNMFITNSPQANASGGIGVEATA